MSKHDYRTPDETKAAVLAAWNTLVARGIRPIYKQLHALSGVNTQKLPSVLDSLEAAGLIDRKPPVSAEPTEAELLAVEQAKAEIRRAKMKKIMAMKEPGGRSHGPKGEDGPRVHKDHQHHGRLKALRVRD
jgi:hypothetical protein